MKNQVHTTGVLVNDPKTRTIEYGGAQRDIVSLWIEAPSGERRDRFSVEIYCPAQQEAAKAMRAGVIAEIRGALRHDRWKIKGADTWTGKIFVAVDPACGKVISHGPAAQSDAV